MLGFNIYGIPYFKNQANSQKLRMSKFLVPFLLHFLTMLLQEDIIIIKIQLRVLV
jgi:hypothetical protein